MASKQVPLLEQKYVTLPPEMEASAEEIKELIAGLFSQLEDDDINVARKLWRELNKSLIQAFTLGLFDISCADCGGRWSVSRRQALNEHEAYRTRKKKCPECGSDRLTPDFEFQLSMYEMDRQAQLRAEEKRRAELESQMESDDGETKAAG